MTINLQEGGENEPLGGGSAAGTPEPPEPKGAIAGNEPGVPDHNNNTGAEQRPTASPLENDKTGTQHQQASTAGNMPVTPEKVPDDDGGGLSPDELTAGGQAAPASGLAENGASGKPKGNNSGGPNEINKQGAEEINDFYEKITKLLNVGATEQHSNGSQSKHFGQANTSGDEGVDPGDKDKASTYHCDNVNFGNQYYSGSAGERLKDPSRESTRVLSSEACYKNRSHIADLVNALLENHVVVLNTSSSELSSSYADLHLSLQYELQEKHKFQLRDADDTDFDLNHYYDHPEIFKSCDPSVTFFKCSGKQIQPLLRRDAYLRIARALAKEQRHLLVLVDNVFETHGPFPYSTVFIWPKPAMSGVEDNNGQSIYDISQPVHAVLRFLAAFFPGLSATEFHSVAEKLISSWPSIEGNKEPEQAEKEPVKEGESSTSDQVQSCVQRTVSTWMTSPDAVIAECNIELSDFEGTAGYSLGVAGDALWLVENLPQKYPLLCKQFFECLQVVYFQQANLSSIFKRAYLDYFTVMVEKGLVSINEDWLTETFHPLRFIRCGNYSSMSRMLDIILQLRQIDGLSVVTESWLLRLAERLCKDEKTWRKMLISDKALCNSVRCGEINNRRRPETDTTEKYYVYLSLSDLLQALMFLLVYGYSDNPGLRLKIFIMLMETRPDSGVEHQALQQGNIAGRWFYPLAHEAERKFKIHVSYSFDNFRSIVESLLEERGHVHVRDQEKRLNTLELLSLFALTDRILSSNDYENDTSVKFVKQMLLTDQQSQSMSCVVALLSRPAVTGFLNVEETHIPGEHKALIFTAMLCERLAMFVVTYCDESDLREAMLCRFIRELKEENINSIAEANEVRRYVRRSEREAARLRHRLRHSNNKSEINKASIIKEATALVVSCFDFDK